MQRTTLNDSAEIVEIERSDRARLQDLLRRAPADLAERVASLLMDIERRQPPVSTSPKAAPPPASHPVAVQAATCDLAHRGAWMADELLADLGADLTTRVRVHQLLRQAADGATSHIAARCPQPAGCRPRAATDPLVDRVIGPSGVVNALAALATPFGSSEAKPSPGTIMARSRLSVGMLGGAGFAPTRLAPLLARAEALGALRG